MIVYRELSSLEQDLGIPAKTLYAVSNQLGRHYQEVLITKRDGGTRKLFVPDKLLKHIQRRICDTLLVPIPISRYATAYHYGSSVLRNAQPHVGAPVVLNLDIFHFFDSIRYCHVKDSAFPPEIYAEPLRILLAMLCYYKDSLPQGAPTSPAITNILMAEFDETVGAWCSSRKIRYTRYCDDMTFSGNFNPEDVRKFVEDALKSMGFLLNERKVKVQRHGQRQTVTGIVVNEKPNIPAAYRKDLRQELYYCQKFGVQSHLQHTGLETNSSVYLMHLLGKVNYVLQVRPQDQEMLCAKQWLTEQLMSSSQR